ncbi:hypothetical protein P4O66_003767 [Electrophorus voltai]|uniref:Uncharacterized protein n=1 Tax=Electrophorus voltai TaxID=2609070 RepID=A0AAD8ZS02_9TELE|nr:hypothetical protein P4O66_003767 [Electrophorus voltai]
MRTRRPSEGQSLRYVARAATRAALACSSSVSRDRAFARPRLARRRKSRAERRPSCVCSVDARSRGRGKTTASSLCTLRSCAQAEKASHGFGFGHRSSHRVSMSARRADGT